MVKVVAALLLAVALSGCQTTGQSTFCDVGKPIIVSRADIKVMSAHTKRAILAHNKKGAKLCRWKRPKR